MKVALLVPGGVDRSGTDRVVPCLLDLIASLVGQGDEVHVFALQHEPVPGSWSLRGATVRNAGSRPRSLRTLRSLYAEHRHGRFDVIHAVCFWTRTAAVGAAASWLLRAPLVLTLLDGEVVGHPAIGFGGQLTARSRLGLRVAAGRAQVVTTQSDFMRDLALGAGIAARTAGLGVDLRHWPARSPCPREAGAPLRLLHIGRFTAIKDHITLLEAMALLRSAGPSFELELIGDGALRAAIERAVQQLDLAQIVRFRPAMLRSELRPWFERADLLVVSSIHEGAPIVALEAAIAGVPTVGTAVGHIADWAPQAAVAVPVGDAPALAAAVRELARDEPRRLRLAAAAQRAAEPFHADRSTQAFREIYGAAMSASSPRP